MREFFRNQARLLNEACHEIAEHSLRFWGFETIPVSDNVGCYEACGHLAPCEDCFDDLDVVFDKPYQDDDQRLGGYDNPYDGEAE